MEAKRHRRCAFLTLKDPTGYVIDDELAYAPLAELGWRVEAVPWNQAGVNWRAFDAVVIRSTWDYTHEPLAFLDSLAEIERAGAPLFNPVDVVRRNYDKRYLRELEASGVPIVPTVWRDRLQPGELPELFDELGAAEIVVKPVVGAGARGAFRVARDQVQAQQKAVEAHYAHQPLMAQPFVASVETEGEYSLFYFNGELSHAIVKTPKAADFRVQEEHGGRIVAVEATDELRAAGDRALQTLAEPLLYARVDLIRAPSGQFWLMELELIEPALYFRMDEESPRRFARALERRARGSAD